MWLRRLFVASVLALAAGIFTGRTATAETLELYSFLDPTVDNVRAKTFAYLIKQFEAANPGVTVKTDVLAWDQLGPNLMRAVQANQPPDVAMIYSPYLGAPIGAGALMPLDDLMAASEATKAGDVLVMQNAQVNGKTYGLPWEMRVVGLINRADWLASKNIQPPVTLDDLAKAAATFNSGQNIGMAVSFNPASPDGMTSWYVAEVIGSGESLLNPDGSAHFATPASAKFLTYLHDFIHKWHAVTLDTALLDEDHIIQLGDSGHAAFDLDGTQRVGLMRKSSGAGEGMSWMPIPGYSADKPAPAWITGWNLVIPSNSKNPKLAWRFIEFWLSPEMQIYQAKAAGYMPVRPKLMDQSDVASGSNEYLRRAANFAAMHPLNFTMPQNGELFSNVIVKMVEKVVTDEMPVDAAMAWAEQEYNKNR
jgi:ABC-type glycerol-3-phosphate transport system substrate-binding protein